MSLSQVGREVKRRTYLVDGVDGLHDPVLEQLEVAELDGVVDAVVLQVLVVRGLDEVAVARHRVAVHVGDTAVASHRVVRSGPEGGSKNFRQNAPSNEPDPNLPAPPSADPMTHFLRGK